jgi:hypothetical protein
MADASDADPTLNTKRKTAAKPAAPVRVQVSAKKRKGAA